MPLRSPFQVDVVKDRGALARVVEDGAVENVCRLQIMNRTKRPQTYTGRGAGGDLPPRPECAPLWMDALRAKLPRVELSLLVGLHAQRHFLGDRRQRSLTETLRGWRDLEPVFFPLPHPSPRNPPWIRTRPWIEHEMLPELRLRVNAILDR